MWIRAEAAALTGRRARRGRRPRGLLPTVVLVSLLLLSILVSAATAFVLPPLATSTSTRPSSSSTSALNSIVFTRLSPESLTALQVAQEQAFLLDQSAVDNSFLLLGLTESPGPAIASTLQKYQITWENVKRVLNYLIVTPSSSVQNNTPTLADFNDHPTTIPRDGSSLPLTNELQQTLYQAGVMAQQMASPDGIQPHHLLLSLLHYKEISPRDMQAATRGDDCPAMELIWHVDATIEAEDICQFLLKALMQDKKKKQQQADKVNHSKDRTAPPSSIASNSASTQQPPSSPSQPSSPTTVFSSVLQECTTDLTQQAARGELDAVHGRDEEIQTCLQILLRRRKNNVCLIGEAGVGKTSIAEGIAQILAGDKCPALLKGHRILSLSISALLAGTKYRGEFEQRFRALIDELLGNNNNNNPTSDNNTNDARVVTPPRPTILFLDEIHTLVGAGKSGEGSLDAANLLKPYLARGQLQLIGATTIVEYNKFIQKDAALERRLQPVLVREPTIEQTVGILQAIVPAYQQHHRVEFTPASLQAAAKLSDRYIQDRFLPDKAIDVLDEAGALATLTRIPNEPAPVVTEKLIATIISKWTHIPVGNLEMDEMTRLQQLEDGISKRVKGQERAVRTVAKAIRRARTGIRNPRRPIASFLFCGPTGVGKTELCKSLAETYYGSERDLIRLDMSEFNSKHSVSRLTGPPPGYVGYEEGGQLTEAVRRAPHSLVLLDELEKAHSDVLNILLQVMEDGILTDGQGRTVSFKNTVLIMTSNIGSKKVLELVRASRDEKKKKDKDNDGVFKSPSKPISTSLTDGRPEYSRLARVVKSELEAVMTPEFLNRIDDIVVFEPLSDLQLSLIALMMSLEIITRAKLERDLDISVTPRLLDRMVKEGSAAAIQFGARPMRRAVQRIFEDAISESVVQGFLQAGDEATFDLKDSNDADELDELDEYEPTAPYMIAVCRSRGKEELCIEVEASSRDLVVDLDPSAPSLDDDDDKAASKNEREPKVLGKKVNVNGEH